MYRIFDSMPFGMYSIVVFLGIFLCIYGIIDLEKRKPGHPYKYVMFCVVPTVLSIYINELLHMYYPLQILLNVLDVTVIIFTVISVFVISYSTYLSIKKGYISEKGKMLLKSTIIPCGIVLIFCILGIILIEYFW